MKGKVLLQGITTNPGTAIGCVRVVNDFANPPVFNQGDILVCNTHEYEEKGNFIKLLKMAGGIVQNSGGRTCSTAIVSRELGKPCIVGTVRVSSKKATDVLKEGVKVVVESNSGVTEVIDNSGKTYKLPYGTVFLYLPDDLKVPEVVTPVPCIPPTT
jgi:pyruvate,water dikinase